MASSECLYKQVSSKWMWYTRGFEIGLKATPGGVVRV